MNETIKTILSRRSIRSFTDEKVGNEIINALLESAIYAPSAKNGQPWFFSVVQSKEILNKIILQGALNLHSQEELYNFFLKKPIVPWDNRKRIVIVFHCEFSSERGPRM